MIRNLTASFIVLAVLTLTAVGAEPRSLFPQPHLPPSPRLLQVSQPTQATTPAPTPGAMLPILTPMPESTHGQMTSPEYCGSHQMMCNPYLAQPVPLREWWSNTAPGRLVHQITEDTCKAKNWPEPFIQYDRDATRLAFTTMVEKGWKRQNTLGNVHFNNNTGDLNISGRVKVRRILFQGLRSRRDLFVYRANTPSDTGSRLNSVKTYVNQLVGTGPNVPQVSITNLPTPGWPAQYIDAISRKYLETMPDPRIPKESEAQFTED